MRTALLTGAALLASLCTVSAQPSQKAMLLRLGTALDKFIHHSGELEGTKCENEAPRDWAAARQSARDYLDPAWAKLGAQLLERLDGSEKAYANGWARGNSFCKLINRESAQSHATQSVRYWSHEIKRHADMVK